MFENLKPKFSDQILGSWLHGLASIAANQKAREQELENSMRRAQWNLSQYAAGLGKVGEKHGS